MSETSESESGQETSCDYEGKFYKVLCEGLGGEKLATPDDLVDTRQGTHARMTTSGDVAVVMVMTPDARDWLLERLGHFEHHNCQESIPAAIGLLRLVGHELVNI